MIVILAKSTHETQTIDEGIGRLGLLFFINILLNNNGKIFNEFLDQTRSGSAPIDKSHGTRLSDQSIDDTIRKPIATKSTSDEAKVPEPFDVNHILLQTLSSSSSNAAFFAVIQNCSMCICYGTSIESQYESNKTSDLSRITTIGSQRRKSVK